MDTENQYLMSRPQRRVHEFLKWVPVVGLSVSLYSALFATFILYPWHIELSKEFSTLSQKINVTLH
jgi:uncharacterized membrane protein